MDHQILRRAVTVLRRTFAIAAVAVTASLAIIVGLTAERAAACDMVGPPTIDLADVPTALDLDGPDRGAIEIRNAKSWFEDTIPPITGAYRVETVEVTPEDATYFSGAISQPTNVWGDAEVVPIEAQVPVRKSKASDCDWNAPPLGSTLYYLSTKNDDPILIYDPDDDDAAVEVALDDLFGASEVVTDQMAEAATGGGRPDISQPEALDDAISPTSQPISQVSLILLGIVTAGAAMMTIASMYLVRTTSIR